MEQLLLTDGNVIRQERIPNDVWLQFRKKKKIATCVDEEWAKKLVVAYNAAHGNAPKEPEEQVSINFFADMVANGVPEVEAAVMTLRYLSGYFTGHIQAKNIKSAADVLFNAYQTTLKHKP